MDRWPISDAALELIKEFEGLRLNAYRDPVGIVTIGYGYTNGAGYGPGVSLGDTWTAQQAEDMLREGVMRFANHIQRYFTIKPNPDQFGAFVSLAYNIGWQSFIKSTALKRWNAGDVSRRRAVHVSDRSDNAAVVTANGNSAIVTVNTPNQVVYGAANEAA